MGMTAAWRVSQVRSSAVERALWRVLPEGNLLLRFVDGQDAADAVRLRRRAYNVGEVVLSTDAATHDRVVFPMSATLSEFMSMRDGAMVESATMGREGMCGIEAILGMERRAIDVIATLAGNVVEVSVPELLALADRVPAFRSMLLRNAAYQLGSGRILAACNALHDTRSRLARWLLSADDRLTTPTFFITHETMSAVLGVRRPSVTLAALDLQRSGALTYSRGTVGITNRSALAEWSCECYLEMRDLLERFIGERI